MLPRSVEHFHAARALPPKTPKNLDRMEFYTTWQSQGGVIEKAHTLLKSSRFRILQESNSLSAEKGFTRETGNLFFHLSLVLILIGVGIGSLFGMRGYAIVNVGERFINVPTSYDSLTFGKLLSEKTYLLLSLLLIISLLNTTLLQMLQRITHWMYLSLKAQTHRP